MEVATLDKFIYTLWLWILLISNSGGRKSVNLQAWIGDLTGWSKAIMMLVCNRWIQEQVTDKRDQMYPLLCNTTRDDIHIAIMVVMDHSATSQTTSQQILYFSKQFVSARVVIYCLQQTKIPARRAIVVLTFKSKSQTFAQPLERWRTVMDNHMYRHCLTMNPTSA